MSKKEIYSCDICRSEKTIKDLIGVCFSTYTDFKLRPANSTEPVHVCLNCAKQLKNQLNEREDV